MTTLIKPFLLSAFFFSLSFSEYSHGIPFKGQKIAMSGPSPYAIEVGKKIAKQGGNTADVAVAMGLTLAVTSPYYAALGGGGFAMIKLGPKVKALDFRETAPQATHPEFYVKQPDKMASRNGGQAIGVPGYLAGLWEIHKTYGKLSWDKLFDEPIRLARDGFQVSGEWSEITKQKKELFSKEAFDHFYKKRKKLYLPGDTIKQPSLTRALIQIQKKGKTPFYNGEIGQDIISTIKSNGGVMTQKDLANYKVRWLEPLVTEFEKHKVYLMPPPSSGGVVIQTALQLIQRLKLQNYKPLSSDELHLFTEIMSRSFRGRAHLADPDFHKNPIQFLTSKSYVRKMANSISKRRTKKLSPLKTKDLPTPINKQTESNETTHFSVMDNQGNAIAITVTLNGRYGSGVVSKKYGIALNNEMDDFTTRPEEPNMFGLIQGQANQVEPGKRPLSSMSPTLITKNGKAVMSLGSPGGPRIINAVLQVLYRVLVNQWNIDKAIQAPRIHHQFLPHKVYVDKDRLSPDVLLNLQKRGHEVKESSVAKVYGVRLNENGFLEAAFDSRGEGGAGGF